MMNLCWIHDESEQVREQYGFLTQTCGYIDFEGRGRLCLTGEDRKAFLHGQVTQDVKNPAVGAGTFSALADGKGKIQSDLNIYCLSDELLLDFDAGLTDMVKERLERYLVSEDADIIDPSEFYTMVSLQGPRAGEALQKEFPDVSLPVDAWSFEEVSVGDDGSIYICHRPRCGSVGYDLFIPKSIPIPARHSAVPSTTPPPTARTADTRRSICGVEMDLGINRSYPTEPQRGRWQM